MENRIISKKWKWLMIVWVFAFLLSGCPGKKSDPMKSASPTQKMQKKRY